MTVFLALLSAAIPSHAAEQYSPALFGVQEMVLQYARIGEKEAAASCNIVTGAIMGEFLTAMKARGLPISSLLEVKPQQPGVPRVDLIPEIVSFYDKGSNCSSWVSLTVQSQVAQVIPPATTPRHVTVTYWHSGALISGLQGLHGRAVTDALLKMGQQLLEQYKTDQPPVPIGAQNQ